MSAKAVELRSYDIDYHRRMQAARYQDSFLIGSSELWGLLIREEDLVTIVPIDQEPDPLLPDPDEPTDLQLPAGDPNRVEQLSGIDPEIGVVDREPLLGEVKNLIKVANRDLSTWKVLEENGNVLLFHERMNKKVKIKKMNKDNPEILLLDGLGYSYKTRIENNKVYMEVMPFGIQGVESAINISYAVNGYNPTNQQQEYDAAMEGLKSFSCGIKNYGSRSQTDILTDMMQSKNGKIELEYGLGTTRQSSSFPIPKDLQEKLIMGADILYYKLGQRTQVGEDVYVQMMLEKRGGRVYIEAKLEAQKSSKLNPVDPEWRNAEQLQTPLYVLSSTGQQLKVSAFNKKLYAGSTLRDQRNRDEIHKMSVDDLSNGTGLKLESGIGRDQLYLKIDKAQSHGQLSSGKEEFVLTMRNGGLRPAASSSQSRELIMLVSEEKKSPSGTRLGRVATFTVVQCPSDLMTTTQSAREYGVYLGNELVKFYNQANTVLQQAVRRGIKLVPGEVLDFYLTEDGRAVFRKGAEKIGEFVIDKSVDIYLKGKPELLKKGVKYVAKVIVKEGVVMLDNWLYQVVKEERSRKP